MQSTNVLLQIYWKVQSIIVPSLKYSQDIYEDVLINKVKDGFIWLELGCGHHILSTWRFNQEKELVKLPKLVIGFDQDLISLNKHRSIVNRIKGDIIKLPFQDNSFDLITSNMVFEHLKDPSRQIKEVYRVLKPGGMLIFHTPNAFSYTTILARTIPDFIKDKLIYFLQGRIKEDVFPTYYRINTPSKIMTIAKDSGFLIESIKLIASSAQLVKIPPLVILELLWIRITMIRKLKNFRTNIIAFLRKPMQLLHTEDVHRE